LLIRENRSRSPLEGSSDLIVDGWRVACLAALFVARDASMARDPYESDGCGRCVTCAKEEAYT